MTRCNHCLLKDIKRHAETIGEAVTVRPVLAVLAKITLGYDVFIHPAAVDPDTLVAHQRGEEPGEYFAAWLAALPDHCVCGGSA